MTTTARLQQLLDSLNGGHDTARDALLAQSLERVRLLARRMFRQETDLRAVAETDDVVSKAMLRLSNALGKVKPPNIRAYFGLAAKHIRWVLRDLARESAAHSIVVFVSEPLDRAAPTDEPTTLLSWAAFHDRIAELPDEERELFDVLFYQGVEQEEAARLLGTSLRTLKRRWQHLRLKLAESMRGELPGEMD